MSMDPLNLESETGALESEMVALGIDEGKKKKKTWSKPGRHWQIKAKVERREKWEAKKGMKENGNSDEGVKVFDERSPFYHAFFFLKEHFPSKVVMPDENIVEETERAELQGLSRQLVTLLRWNLPKTGIAYDSMDGSVDFENVAKHLKRSITAISHACSPSIGGKRRLTVFQVMKAEKLEKRVAAVGGHGFALADLCAK